MANIRLIKRRIKSAKNIAQITKAMELVAASRMRKAQALALAGRAYAQKIYDMVMDLAPRVDGSEHPLLMKPKQLTGTRFVIVVSTNKGLCGGLNTNLFRFISRQYPDMTKARYAVIGKKAGFFFSRMAPERLVADFSGTVPFVQSVPAISAMASETFTRGEVDGVDLVYNECISALKQHPRKKTILPITIGSFSLSSVSPSQSAHTDMLIEPDEKTVFEALLPHYLENQLRDAILQSEASEQSARMMAMRNATDNATGLAADLTLVYNKIRQEKITYEITDMITARLAVAA
jgi:F-type H+-transporting ATPase subunit gamma